MIELVTPPNVPQPATQSVDEEMVLYSISDIHVGNPFFDEKGFRTFLETKILANPRARFVVNGDVGECVIIGSKGEIYEQTMSPYKQGKYAAKLLEPVAAQCLAVTSGNHDARPKGATSMDITADLADALHVPYKSEGILLRLAFRAPRLGVRGPDASYVAYFTHGWAGGRTPGSQVNMFVELGKIVVADIYALGHTHNQWTHYDEITIPDLARGRMVQQKRYYAMSGSWLRYGGYSQVKGYRQVPMGCPEIRLGMIKKAVSLTIS